MISNRKKKQKEGKPEKKFTLDIKKNESPTYSASLSETKEQPVKLIGRTKSDPTGLQEKDTTYQPIVSPSGSILCDSNFSSFLFSEIFSAHVQMKPCEDNIHFLLTAGSLQDLIHYMMLHSHPELFSMYTNKEPYGS